jgi:ureidoacrylate peracid hydrolase
MALTIEKEKTAFLALDFINDLVHEAGKLMSFDTAAAAHIKQTNVLANTKKAIKASRQAGIPVIYVAVQFREGYPELSGVTSPMFSGARERGEIVEGSWGTQIHDEVKPQPDELIVPKRRVSAFHGTELGQLLHVKGITTLVLSGVATNFAVEGTARCAHDEGYQVIILRDCCASSGEEIHSFTLNNLLPRLATISDSEEYIKALV